MTGNLPAGNTANGKNPITKAKPVHVPGITIGFYDITPDIATEWLGRNHKNRGLKHKTVEAYATDMRNKAWLLTHQGVAFNASGDLIDGQHRLHAIVDSKQTVRLLVSAGWGNTGKQKTMDAVDRGVQRSIADQLGVQHDMAAAKDIVPICNGVVSCATGHLKVFKSTTDMTLKVVEWYRAELSWVLAAGIKEHGLKQALMQACLVMCRTHQPWHAKLDDAIARLRHGENLNRDNALLWLRNFLLGGSQGEARDVIRRVVFFHLVNFLEGRAVKALIKDDESGYLRVLRMQEDRVRKICTLYNQLPPEVLRMEDDKVVTITPSSPEGIKLGLSLREPFSNLDLTARLDPGANAGNWLMVWRNRGWIEPVGLESKRTAKFGKL